MNKLLSTIVLAFVSLALISYPGRAIAEPSAPAKEEVKALPDVDLGHNWSVAIPRKSVIAYKNNNPGNLRFAGQKGATKGYSGFAYFENPIDGFDALKNQIKIDSNRGLTVEQFVHKFAPLIENDTHLYLDQVLERFSVDGNHLLSDMPINSLAIFIAMKESNTVVKILP